jgi:hypothetical protein
MKETGFGTLAAADRRARAATSQCEFRAGWSFKGNATATIDKMIADTEGPILHVCCGAAILPREDLRVDLYHPSADRAWDARFIDVECAKEGIRPGVIVIDPPYGKKMWPLPYRQRVVNACMRALRGGGPVHRACSLAAQVQQGRQAGGLLLAGRQQLGFPGWARSPRRLPQDHGPGFRQAANLPYVPPPDVAAWRHVQEAEG